MHFTLVVQGFKVDVYAAVQILPNSTKMTWANKKEELPEYKEFMDVEEMQEFANGVRDFTNILTMNLDKFMNGTPIGWDRPRYKRK